MVVAVLYVLHLALLIEVHIKVKPGYVGWQNYALPPCFEITGIKPYLKNPPSHYLITYLLKWEIFPFLEMAHNWWLKRYDNLFS